LPGRRRFAHDALDGRDENTVSLAMLIVNELVSNAVRHTSGEVSLAIRSDANEVHISVDDADPNPPRLIGIKASTAYGRGLRIVDWLVDRWGSTVTDHGKTVWCVLRLPGDHVAP